MLSHTSSRISDDLTLSFYVVLYFTATLPVLRSSLLNSNAGFSKADFIMDAFSMPLL